VDEYVQTKTELGLSDLKKVIALTLKGAIQILKSELKVGRFLLDITRKLTQGLPFELVAFDYEQF